MVQVRKNVVARSAVKGRGAELKASAKTKPAAKKPAPKATKPAARTVVAPVAKAGSKVAPKKPVAKAPVKPAPKVAAKPVAKAIAKPAVKAPAKPVAKTSAKPAAPKGPAPLNAGAARAKELAEKKRAEAAAAAAALAEKNRVPRLVRATPEALRAQNAPKIGPGGKPIKAKPLPEVRPLGVLPVESMAKVKPSGVRVVIPMAPRVESRPMVVAKPEERLTKADLKYFEERLLKERARIMGELGHLESTIIKVNPRDAAGETLVPTAEAGSDSLDREVSFDIASKEGRLLREITDALARIYNGVFGVCESSGQPIARARLEALPWARFTVQEQENIERQQRAGRLAIEDE